MNISRSENEKELAEKFENDSLICYSLAPGREYSSFMCSVGIKKEIENFFGKSKNKITGKSNRASFFAFNFNDKTIICTNESNIGTAWYWNSAKEEGTRYGNPMLLPSDKEVKDFWPYFCKEFTEVLNNSLTHTVTSKNKPKF